jgi:Kef-type K+ transport system membrane component KefB
VPKEEFLEESVFKYLLILMVVIWTVAVMLHRIGLPTIMGELVMGVILGPAVLGWVHPSEIIEILAQMGIFFLMLHTGVETEPQKFFAALRVSMGVAVVGGVVPFSVSMAVALAFGLPMVSALFVGLTMTATAVVVTLKILRDLGLQNTRMARVIVASCIIDDLLTLLMFSIVIGVVREGGMDLHSLLLVGVKSVLFFGVAIAVGYWLYPLFKHPFQSRRGKGFTFILILGLGFGLLAEAIGLHMVIGAYLAGLFFSEKVASRELMQKVEDRLNAIAYSFLGPIFFISLGFHITFDVLTGPGLWFMVILTSACLIGQVISAGGMAGLLGFSFIESLTVGVGMCGRAEMAFVLASLGLSMGAIDARVFSVLIFTAFVLTLLTPAGLKGCSLLLQHQIEREEDDA